LDSTAEISEGGLAFVSVQPGRSARVDQDREVILALNYADSDVPGFLSGEGRSL
jgi:hypothetical protein